MPLLKVVATKKMETLLRVARKLEWIRHIDDQVPTLKFFLVQHPLVFYTPTFKFPTTFPPASIPCYNSKSWISVTSQTSPYYLRININVSLPQSLNSKIYGRSWAHLNSSSFHFGRSLFSLLLNFYTLFQARQIYPTTNSSPREIISSLLT